MLANWVIKAEFQEYDNLETDFYSETKTSKRFDKYRDLIQELCIAYLPLLKKKDLSSWKKNLRKIRKRRTLKAAKKTLKKNKARKAF